MKFPTLQPPCEPRKKLAETLCRIKDKSNPTSILKDQGRDRASTEYCLAMQPVVAFMRYFLFLIPDCRQSRFIHRSKQPCASLLGGFRSFSVLFIVFFLFLMGSLLSEHAGAAAASPDSEPRKILFLGTKFQNDHEGQEPTSEAERGRIHAIEDILRSQLEATGRFRFIPASAEIQSKSIGEQTIGDCGGCEIDLGMRSGADISAWIIVQKVSNLILNINLYMVDVPKRKILLAQSVDIRGNTDLSWTRGMNYLLKNHILRHGFVNSN